MSARGRFTRRFRGAAARKAAHQRVHSMQDVRRPQSEDAALDVIARRKIPIALYVVDGMLLSLERRPSRSISCTFPYVRIPSRSLFPRRPPQLY